MFLLAFQIPAYLFFPHGRQEKRLGLTFSNDISWNQGSHRNWTIKFNDFSMTNLNFPWLRKLKTQPFWAYLCLMTRRMFPVFREHQIFGPKHEIPWLFYLKSKTFSRPGKYIFKFHDFHEFHEFSWPCERCGTHTLNKWQESNYVMQPKG